MTPQAFRKLALSMPDAYEEPHFDRASFRIGKKIFATMTADGKEAMVVVKDPDALNGLLSSFPDVFFSHGGWTIRNGSLGVRLGNVDAALLKELLTESYASVVKPAKKKAPAKKSSRRGASRR